jgi:hypothetical protein
MGMSTPLAGSRGSILLSLSLVIFIGSLLAAGTVMYLVRSQRSGTPAVLPSTDTVDDVLTPAVTLDPAFESERGNVQTNLIGPLREYYATREERLAEVTVAKPLDEGSSHPARVSLQILSPNGEARMVSFGYDLSPWTPSMLDNE